MRLSGPVGYQVLPGARRDLKALVDVAVPGVSARRAKRACTVARRVRALEDQWEITGLVAKCG